MTIRKRDSIITEAEILFAELLMKGESSLEQCAEQAGFTRSMGRQVRRRPCVLKYMQERRDRLLAELEKKEIAGLQKFDLGRDAIITQLWQIANLSATETKGSVTGQVQALNCLSGIFGLIAPGGDR